LAAADLVPMGAAPAALPPPPPLGKIRDNNSDLNFLPRPDINGRRRARNPSPWAKKRIRTKVSAPLHRKTNLVLKMCIFKI